ncbi:MAG: hypothetical protein R3324_12945 [Halobacteriales archaeon]|nr:hypothetical protein [Halobacteriales archaeon]
MSREVKLSHLDRVLSEFDYPLAREEAIETGADVTLVLADGETNLGETIRHSHDGHFSSPDELLAEVMSLLPRHAVGEPFQSDGDS